MFGRKKMRQIEAELEAAREELAEAKKTKSEVEDRVGFIEKLKLKERWERVHERNNLSELFITEYRRTR